MEWMSIVKQVADGDCQELFENNWRTVKSGNLEYFQYQIICRILLTNKKLKHFKLVEDDIRSFCKQGTETIEYDFYSCPEVQNLWSKT